MLFHRHKNGYRVQSEVTIDGVRHRKTKVVKNKAEAREFDAWFRSEMQSGIMDASIRFDVYGQQYIDNILGLEQRTIDSYQCISRPVLCTAVCCSGLVAGPKDCRGFDRALDFHADTYVAYVGIYCCCRSYTAFNISPP